MYIAMNRFRVVAGKEEAFTAAWRERESHLDGVPGFRAFHLLRGPGDGTTTLFASHSTWDDAAVFEAWTRSEAFRKAHAGAGATSGMLAGPPQFEGFEAVL